MSTLFLIEHALSDLFDVRQDLEEQQCFTEEDKAERRAAQDAVDLAIVEYVTAGVRKVDNIARRLVDWQAQRKAIEHEIARLATVVGVISRNEERLRDIVLQVMRDCDVKKLEGKIGTLRRQNNGGVLGVDVRQPELVPPELQMVSVKMSLETWETIKSEMWGSSVDFVAECGKPEPNLSAIRFELEKRVPCPECEGVGVIERRVADADKVDDPCPRCNKTGTVPNGVPGCVLLERGEHLRVS